MTHVFRFSTTWHVPVAGAVLFDALSDVDRYAAWWPQVRSLRRLSSEAGETCIRSLLPHTLRLVLTRDVEDPATGTLRVRLGGDLTGWARWQVHAGRADYTQECVVTASRLAAVAGPLAPVLRANHAWMMCGGRRGLTAYLARP